MSLGLSLSAVGCLLCCLAVINGSVINFQSSPDDVKQGLTTTLTLNCSLTDTSASTSIIGKRDVTQTTDNVLVLTSLVVMKNGQDVASINTAVAAHVMDGSANLQVSGSVAGHSGFLQLTYKDPRLNQTGEFVCEANAVSVSGHVVTFSTTAEVSTSTPSIADLVTYVRDLSKKNEGLESTVVTMQGKLDILENNNQVLEQTVSRLQNRSDTMVFFNARINGNPHLGGGQYVVFDHVLHNLGNDYNGANGHFTCTVPGYYDFSLGCLSMPEKAFGMRLLHNSNVIFNMYGASGNSYQAAANGATLQLARGDVVKVQTTHDSTINGDWSNFSGHLIEAL